MHNSEAQKVAVSMIVAALGSKSLTLSGPTTQAGTGAPSKLSQEAASTDAKYILSLYSELVAGMKTYD